ncbi:MAG: HEAT repeat domain-containing protein [Planctomycetes bacterium]|nr:HEAT repeat domain-containing protein [Planctomycetota bacterium]
MRPYRTVLQLVSLATIVGVGCQQSLLQPEPAMAPIDRSADAERVRVQLHIAEVVHALRSADTTHLTVAQREKRAQLLSELAAYGERGVFPTNTYFPDRVTPIFRDQDGRVCTLANLMQTGGAADLLDEFARTRNHDFAAMLDDDPRYIEWLQTVGLSPAEAARVHGGFVGTPPPPPQGWEPSHASNAALRALPKPLSPYGGPADVAAPRPSVPTGPAPSGPRSTGPISPTTPTMPSAPMGPITPALAQEEPWTDWWNLHQVEFFRRKPGDLAGGGAVTLRLEGDRVVADDLSATRAKVLQIAQKDVRHEEALRREAAAFALGRLGGENAVEPLRGLLTDSSPEVRNAAILALGASGSSKAAHQLIRLAWDGTTEPGGIAEPTVRALAIVGLGLARSRGASGAIDPVIETLYLSTWGSATERATVRKACMTYQALSPTHILDPYILASLRDPSEDLAVRAQAVETIAKAQMHMCYPDVVSMLSHKRVEMRRSAALALGHIRQESTLPALAACLSSEKDDLVRGYAMISMGRLGGADSVAALKKELLDGEKRLRPWAALGLGMAAGLRHPAAVGTLSAAMVEERNMTTREAEVLAIGLTRDPRHAATAAKVLDGSRSESMRRYAMTSLALTAGASARGTLRDAVMGSTSPFESLVASFMLGYLGDSRDCELLVQELRRARNPHEAHLHAIGVSRSRSAETVNQLVAQLEGSDRVAYYGAMHALGLLIPEDAGFHLSTAMTSSNAELWEPWQRSLTETML